MSEKFGEGTDTPEEVKENKEVTEGKDIQTPDETREFFEGHELDEIENVYNEIVDAIEDYLEELAEYLENTPEIAETIEDLYELLIDMKEIREDAEALFELVNNEDLSEEDKLELIQEFFGDKIQDGIEINSVSDILKSFFEVKLGWEIREVSTEDLEDIRKEFNANREDLIKEWEDKHGVSWPTYTEPVYSAAGRIWKRVGDRYDAHHIIGLKYGGKNEASNIVPLRQKDHSAVHHNSYKAFTNRTMNTRKDV